MTHRSQVEKPPASPDTRLNETDDVISLTHLLHRAHRAISQSRELCHRTAILQHSGRGPPQLGNHQAD